MDLDNIKESVRETEESLKKIDDEQNNDIVIRPDIVNVRISPYAFCKYAEDFFDVAEKVRTLPKFSFVPYYLYCHSIELSLKSLMLFVDEDITIRSIKEYGHNLEKILDKAEKKSENTILNSEDKKVISLVNDFYWRKGFEYYTLKMMEELLRGHKNLPDIVKLRKICKRVLEKAKTKTNQ